MKHGTTHTPTTLHHALAPSAPRRRGLPMKFSLPCLATAAAVSLQLAACTEMMRTDSANHARKSSQARQAALLNNQTASRQAAPAQPVAGQALVQLLAGQSHISEFRRQSQDSQPYFVSYGFFEVGGGYVASDTYSQHSPATYTHGVWSVSGPVLCITGMDGNELEQCFTMRVEPGGAVQYWMHKPGDPFHGLIAARVHLIREGQQTPAFVSTPAQ